MDVRARIDRDGYAHVPALVDAATCDALGAAIEPLLSAASGGRRLPADHDAIAPLLTHARVVAVMRDVLGPSAAAVRVVVFDKNRAANWAIRWHQDAAVAVRTAREGGGFRGASVKDGMPHVLAPPEVLERMVALRVHLDDVAADGGALRVVPGTHRLGRIEPAEITGHRRRLGEVSLPAGRGDAILMRPLCLHSSAKASRPTRRRVVHIECAAGDLPAGLEWFARRLLG